jgi:DMSO/TMAO reductase YedYZ molybdopterin-dependent catalytic subunit
MQKNNLLTRRQALIAGVSSLGALVLPGCSTEAPPTYGSILRMGDALTYVAQRTLLPGQSLAKEYAFGDISSMPATGTTDPAKTAEPAFAEEYARSQKNGFADWQISVEGLVSRPTLYSLQDLQLLPSRTQITKHFCEEGWSAIAQWTGVPLSTLLQDAGILPEARYVNFYSYDGWADNLDMIDAFHPQTILAYGMNGRKLAVPHGAPLRLRVERQVGYKSMKYLKRIEVTDKFLDTGDYGWAWYVGI